MEMAVAQAAMQEKRTSTVHEQEIVARVSHLNGRVQKIAMARDGLINSIERLEDN